MRFSSLAFAVLALPACVAAPDLGSQQQDIVGGSTAQSTQYPSVVGLEEEPGNWFCTGTLITPEWVLTAAHCVDEEPAGVTLHVRFGANEINSGNTGTLVEVAEVHEKEDFNYDAWDNDIALLKLKTPVTNVTPTPIHRPQLAAGATITEVGYGASNNNQNGNDGAGLLRKVDRTTVSCSAANDPGISDANLICMSAADGKGSCYGDSGGPAFLQGANGLEVAGVTSGGSEENCGVGFDLYTSVYGELAWVDSVMNGTTPTPDPGTPDPGTGSGSGSGGSGNGNGEDVDTHHDGDGGCSTGGSHGGLAFIGFAAIAIVRRRRK